MKNIKCMQQDATGRAESLPAKQPSSTRGFVDDCLVCIPSLHNANC